MGQYWSQSCPPVSKFNPDDIPDLSGKVMIVTGESNFSEQNDRETLGLTSISIKVVTPV